jgi:hypothetical protein
MANRMFSVFGSQVFFVQLFRDYLFKVLGLRGKGKIMLCFCAVASWRAKPCPVGGSAFLGQKKRWRGHEMCQEVQIMPKNRACFVFFSTRFAERLIRF